VSEAKKNPTLAPLLGVRRGREAIEFYKKAFGAVEIFRTESEDGSVVAQLSIGAHDFWLADESPEHKNYSPESLGGSTMRMVLVADDPDAVFRPGRASGRDGAVADGGPVVWVENRAGGRSVRASLGDRQAASLRAESECDEGSQHD
jgi:uncharacterized glyoxalase superfamily protein PhnB